MQGDRFAPLLRLSRTCGLISTNTVFYNTIYGISIMKLKQEVHVKGHLGCRCFPKFMHKSKSKQNFNYSTKYYILESEIIDKYINNEGLHLVSKFDAYTGRTRCHHLR